MKIVQMCIAAAVLLLPLSAKTWNVGPNQEYQELTDVDWLHLEAGDSVKIHWKSEPYLVKLGLRCTGTEELPVVISGVPNALGELPVLSGENARTDEQFNGYFSAQWDEFLGVFIIKKGPDDSWGYKPKHIIIENLTISNAHADYTYTASDGSLVSYAHGAAAIWAVLVENLTVRNCVIAENGNGFFVLSKNNAEEETSRNIKLQNCTFTDNGNVGRDREHNIYTQVAGMLIEGCRIDRLRDGAQGSSIKDRSSGTVIRYNRIESSARAIDLVDPEDSYMIITEEEDFLNTYVYGNIILDNTAEPVYSTNLIHYGGDSGVFEVYRNGTLYFYNNTVWIRSMQSDAWYLRLFDLSTNNSTVELWNNCIYREGTSEFYLMNSAGNMIVHEGNWISTDYIPGRSGYSGTISGEEFFLTGTEPLLDSITYSPVNGSPLLDAAVTIEADFVTRFPCDFMFDTTLTHPKRVVSGIAPDIGAYEFEDLSTPVETTIRNSIRTDVKMIGNQIRFQGIQPTEVQLYSLNGKQLFKRSVSASTSAVTLPNVSKGSYIVVVTIERIQKAFTIAVN